MKRFLLFNFAFLIFNSVAFAQTEEPQMADGFRADGKIFVVVLVLSVVFACLATYLIIIDRKIKKLEDNFSNKK
ncbi:MAG: CcmD family protein [Bacteroidia bacterium]